MTVVASLVCRRVALFRRMLGGRCFGSCRIAFEMAARWVLRFGGLHHRCLDSQGKKKGDEPKRENDQPSAGCAHGRSGLPVEKQGQRND